MVKFSRAVCSFSRVLVLLKSPVVGPDPPDLLWNANIGQPEANSAIIATLLLPANYWFQNFIVWTSDFFFRMGCTDKKWNDPLSKQAQ